MEIKILQVFYGKDGLPYKDKDRQVHFPIAGTGFLGASNTTKIKFYYDELDDLDETTWVAVSKLPNGKVGSRVLESFLDEELNEHYALLELDNYYTQYKGDVFISLQGYQGGVDFDYDEENSQYEIHGTPTIAATGSIKFTINYANHFIGSGETDNINFQRILAALGTKLGMRAYSEYVEELPSEGSPDIFYVIKDDPNNPNLANIYVWNENTKHYIWVGDNTLDLGNYYTQEQGNEFEDNVQERLNQQDIAISSLGQLQPSGVDTSTNILAFNENKGIYIGSDTGNWYYWDGTQYVSGGTYQATEIANDSITPEKTTFIKELHNNLFPISGINSNYGCSISKNIITTNSLSYNGTFGLNCNNLGIASGTKTLAAGTYYLSLKIKGSVSGGGLSIRFYDTNGNRTNLTTLSATVPTDSFGNMIATFTLSQSVNGFGFMFVNGLNQTIVYTVKDIFLSNNVDEFFAYLLDSSIYINANNIIGSFNLDKLTNLLEEYNVVDINRCQIGRWQSNSGSYHPSATNSLCTNYIKTNILKINKISVNSNSVNVIICEYNSSKTFLRGAITNYQGVGQTYTISNDAVFITLSFPNTYTDFSVIGYKIKKELEEPNYKTKRVLCIGDSLTQGVDYSTHVIAENYPYFLEKDFNFKTYNHGFMGLTAQGWWANRMQYVDFNYTFDIALIMLGTNGGLTDTLATDVEPYNSYNDYANTDTGCYCKIIEKIMESSPRTQIILVIPPYNYFDETKYNVLLTAVNEIPKIAERYALPIIDLFRCSGMNLKNGSLFRPNDNLHFNAKGYHKIATYIGNQLKAMLSWYDNTDVYDDEYGV